MHHTATNNKTNLNLSAYKNHRQTFSVHAPEHVHEYEGEHGGEEERANVPRHTADHIQERFLVVDEVEKLQCT